MCDPRSSPSAVAPAANFVTRMSPSTTPEAPNYTVTMPGVLADPGWYDMQACKARTAVEGVLVGRLA